MFCFPARRNATEAYEQAAWKSQRSSFWNRTTLCGGALLLLLVCVSVGLGIKHINHGNERIAAAPAIEGYQNSHGRPANKRASSRRLKGALDANALRPSATNARGVHLDYGMQKLERINSPSPAALYTAINGVVYIGNGKDMNQMFMDHGYAMDDPAAEAALEAEAMRGIPPGDESEKTPFPVNNRFSRNMYYITATHGFDDAEARWRRADVLEISCNRCAGSAYLARRFKPKSLTALDITASNIEHCGVAHPQLVQDGSIHLQEGDAQALPFEDEAFDILINIEASDHYTDLKAFMEGVVRVLRPGGVLLWSGDGFESMLEGPAQDAGLTMVFNEDIRSNAYAARSLTKQLSSPHEQQVMKDMEVFFNEVTSMSYCLPDQQSHPTCDYNDHRHVVFKKPEN